MEINDLDKILKEIPILIVPDISFKRGDKTFKAEGMAIQKHRADGTVMKYTALNYNCDDITRGLLHESIHHYYTGGDDWYVTQVENLRWKQKAFRELCQNKIVELLGKYDL